ncbi:MAG: phosphatase PAP2 family protein [Patescibacteria group bacterium]|jgi:membrane-associated phospholipid phosphatase
MMIPLIRKPATTRRLLLIGYAALILLFWVMSYRSLRFDLIFLILLGAAAMMQRGRSFIKDWLPILMILLAYEATRGMVDDLGWRVHITDLINTERWLFGTIPTVDLQRLWYTAGIYHWYDYVFALFYGSFYFIPFVAGFILWIKQRSHFRFFANGLALLTLAGFVTYALFPAMPPWMASEQGYISGVTKILVGLTQYAFKVHLPSLYMMIGANQVAAMPSLHSAWPWYTFLCLTYFYRWKAVWFIVVPTTIWLGVVYLGEHYIIDVIAGVVYATIAFLIVYALRKHILDTTPPKNYDTPAISS